jgi:hypothetical protein
MNVVSNSAVCISIFVASATMAIAHPPVGGPGGQRSGGPGGGGHRPGGHDAGRAVLMALDTDCDHEISAAEIENAVATLLKLDTNGDGKLNDKDLAGGQRGERAGQQGDRPQGPRPEKGGADSPRHQGPGGPPEPKQMVEHAMEFDVDKDGKLDKSELLKFAEQLGPPPGGPGGGPHGQEGAQGGSDGQQRPNRPSRPGK